MGRIFEVRKSTMFARWDRMAKHFTRIGKEIVIAVKAGGPDPSYQCCIAPLLSECEKLWVCPRTVWKLLLKEHRARKWINYDEILYEGYAPHGVAILVETATDNHVRTVANVKSHFNKGWWHIGQ